MKSTKSIVVASMPRAGLGNKLFCLAHSFIFGEVNGLKVYYKGLNNLKIFTFLKKLKIERNYKNILDKKYQIDRFSFLKKQKKHFVDYRVCVDVVNVTDNTTYVFNQIPEWNDYFLNIRENRKLVIEKIENCLSISILKELDKKEEPTIGVHIRMGDFRKLKDTEKFSKVGAVRTPFEYFKNLINKIRQENSATLDVTIFSDGNANELSEILNMPNVKLAEKDTDVMQMLHLSKSKIIILSAGSTYGQWAAFLSSAAIINHYQHFHFYIRDEETNKSFFEGVCKPKEDFPKLLKKNIQAL
jgi:hypothetical protein